MIKKVVVFILICTSSPLFGKDISILLGTGASDFHSQSTKTSHSELYTLSIYKRFPLFSFLAIKGGTALSAKNARIENYWETQKSMKFSLIFLDFPLLYSIHKNFGVNKNNLYFDIGTRFSFALYDSWATETSYKDYTNKNSGKYDKKLHTWQLGMIVALGFEIHNKYIIEIKTDYNLTDLYNYSQDTYFNEELNNFTFNISLGMKI